VDHELRILLHLITAALYGVLALYFWRTRWGSATAAASQGWERVAMLVPLALHAELLYATIFAGGALHLGVGDAISLIAWLTLTVYWAGDFFYPMEGLQALVIPGVALAVVLPLVLPASPAVAYTGMPAFTAHFVVAMLAYSLFTIASLHVLLMAYVERRLREGTLPAMEQLLFRIIGAGFLLLTLALASGILFSEEVFGKPLRFNHKTVFGIAAWIIFGLLLAGRVLRGWRGRVATRWTLAGFLLLVLAYIGSKFVLEVILGRT
jgi:ABC-type uncharacterized transport system permease subunit